MLSAVDFEWICLAFEACKSVMNEVTNALAAAANDLQWNSKNNNPMKTK